MIGEDTQPQGHKTTGNWPFLLLIIAKGLRASSLFTAFALLYQIPLILCLSDIHWFVSIFPCATTTMDWQKANQRETVVAYRDPRVAFDSKYHAVELRVEIFWTYQDNIVK
jgi:hypothetical protein